jgi:hypothetical protein
LDLHSSFQDPHANRARALLVNGDGRDRRRRQRLEPRIAGPPPGWARAGEVGVLLLQGGALQLPFRFLRLDQKAKSWPWVRYCFRDGNSAAPCAYGQTLHRCLSRHDRRHRRASSAVRRRQETLAIEAIQTVKLGVRGNERLQDESGGRFLRARRGKGRMPSDVRTARSRPPIKSRASSSGILLIKCRRRHGRIALIASLARGSILSRTKVC